VKCLHCGFITGSWVGEKGSPVTVGGLTDREGGRLAAESGGSAPVRCGRCEGPVFLEAPEPVISGYRLRRIRRLREQIAALDARGGRAA
jgi:hypothetical protein